jgi:FAD binding domain
MATRRSLGGSLLSARPPAGHKRSRVPPSPAAAAGGAPGVRLSHPNHLLCIPAVVSVEQLRGAIAGTVVRSSDPDWDASRQAWNLTADQHPAFVVRAGAVGDIAATVRFAAANGLRVAVQATGHGATSLGELEDAVLLRTSELDGVVVDPKAQTARVQAGAQWRGVIVAAAQHGLVGLHGMSGGVGVAGYVLGGGIGWLARREGFASTHIRSFEVVTADGEERTVDREHEPDLFWALRGGGGGQAIVTALELELFELREAFGGAVLWPIDRASEVVGAYRAWIATAPDTVTSTLKLIRFPPLPAIPEPLRGRALVAITLAFTGGEAEGAELVAPLRAVAAPYLDTLAVVPASALGDLSGDPQDPTPGLGRAMLFDTLTASAAEAFVELAGPDADTPLTALELRHLGGALRSPTPDPGAAGPLASEALIYGVGAASTPEAGAAVKAALTTMSDRLAPWVGARRTLLTFAEEPGLRYAFTDPVADRLAQITARYDPAGLLVANHVAD